MKLSFCAVCASLIFSAITFAQTPGCDEGVIRLPDRSGTIQICSALAMQVPELAEQLQQATEMLESQEDQIAELTRLVRGLNTVSRGIGLERQAEMLQSLSTELAQTRQSEQNEALSQIASRLDELQLSLLDALTNPTTTSTLVDALKGPVGDAIAKLDLSGATQQIEDINQRLTAIESGVDSIQSDTAAIRQQLAQMDQQQQMAQAMHEERGALTIELLRQISGEVRELDQRGGLINNANTFAEHYHNARILAQRGEIDLALASYRAVFRTGVQMADPMIDLVTLLIRQYGRRGALEALTRDFEEQLPALSFLYGLQLLGDRDYDNDWEVIELFLDTPELVSEFPPLAALSLRHLHNHLARRHRNLSARAWLRYHPPLNPHTFDWSTAVRLTAVFEKLDEEIQTGNYLAFFIDAIRANQDLHDFREASETFNRESVLRVNVPNIYHRQFQAADLANSPAVLDHTYLLEPPPRSIISTIANSEHLLPVPRSGSIYLFIWDYSLDDRKPIELCTGSTSNSKCIDMNTPQFRCRSESEWGARRATDSCLEFDWAVGDQLTVSPYVRAQFVTSDLLGQACIEQLRYSSRTGREIRINAGDLIAISQCEIGEVMRSSISACGYDLQTIMPPGSNMGACP